MFRYGWVSKYDLWTLTMLSEVRACINSRNIAISRDGKHIAVANHSPHSLVMSSTDDLSVQKIFRQGTRTETPRECRRCTRRRRATASSQH